MPRLVRLHCCSTPFRPAPIDEQDYEPDDGLEWRQQPAHSAVDWLSCESHLSLRSSRVPNTMVGVCTKKTVDFCVCKLAKS